MAEIKYAICGAPTDNELLEAIKKAVAELKEQHEWVLVICVSHSVTLMPQGNFLWTALITCEVYPKETPSTSPKDQSQ